MIFVLLVNILKYVVANENNIIIKTELGNSLTQAREPELIKGIALGRLGSPRDVAQLVAFLATVEPNFMTGQDFKIDGFQWVI